MDSFQSQTQSVDQDSATAATDSSEVEETFSEEESHSHRNMDTTAIDYWVDKCSICFDQPLAFNLSRCRDQFCVTCFDRFVKEILSNAWGLAAIEVKCPVCSDILHFEEWRRYVRSDTISHYERIHRHYPVLTRHCGQCSTAVVAFKSLPSKEASRESLLEAIQEIMKSPNLPVAFNETFFQIWEQMTDLFKHQRIPLSQLHSIFMKRALVMLKEWQEMEQREAQSNASKSSSNTLSQGLPGLSHTRRSQSRQKRRASLSDVSQNRGRRQRSVQPPPEPLSLPTTRDSSLSPSETASHSTPSLISFLSNISSLLIQMECDSKSWRQLQLIHVTHFPQTHCENCHTEMCLKCGESSHHKDQSCTDYLRAKCQIAEHSSSRRRSSRDASGDTLATLQWQLSHTKPCPTCGIIIYRDEGCHRVDCVFCGAHFCWQCLRPWGSRACGYYLCTSTTTASTTSQSEVTLNQALHSKKIVTELGVPDIQNIELRLQQRS